MGGKQACIVGIGQTEYRRWGGVTDRSELQLACEAIKSAAGDAGVDLEHIDGLCSYAADRNEPSFVQDALGLERVRYISMVWGGGGAGSCGALLHAVTAIDAGAADYVVVFRALCQGQSRRYGRFHAARPGNNFMAPFGMLSPPIMMAPLIQRYMHEFGTRQEALGEIALVARDNACRNPAAIMHGQPLSMSDYLGSRMIASPLHLNDCCQESDGACAVLVTSLERARDLRRKPVRVLAVAQVNTPGWGTGSLATHNMPAQDYAGGNSWAVARQVFASAGLRPSDVDVAQIYDHFTGLVLMSLENYGFCGRGEAGDFVSAGHVRWPDGSIPINTSGGHLSEAYIHGLNLLVEGVKQIRGESTSQVAGAETCLVTGGNAAPFPSAAILAG